MIPVWDNRVGDWVAARIPGCQRGFERFTAMGVVSNEELIAGIVFSEWNPEAGTIEISGAATNPRWFCRRIINEALGYVFDELKCQMLLARQRADNDRARLPWLALGGSEVAIPRLYGRDTDGTVITLTEEQWRASKFYRSPDNG